MKKILTNTLATLAITASANAFSAPILIDGTTGPDRANHEVTFSFSGLSAHESVSINFDLYIQDSWDGGFGGCCAGPDIFGFRVDGVEIYSGTFNNFSTFADSNPANVATSTGNFNGINAWGPIDRYWDNFNYNNGIFEISHTSADLDVTFFGTGLQGVGDESWRVTDLDISTNEITQPTAVSEPGTFALLGLGLAGLGLVRRRSAK